MWAQQHYVVILQTCRISLTKYELWRFDIKALNLKKHYAILSVYTLHQTLQTIDMYRSDI